MSDILLMFGLWKIMEQVLGSLKKTNLHDDLLEVISLHTSPVMTLPRIKMLEVSDC